MRIGLVRVTEDAVGLLRAMATYCTNQANLLESMAKAIGDMPDTPKTQPDEDAVALRDRIKPRSVVTVLDSILSPYRPGE